MGEVLTLPAGGVLQQVLATQSTTRVAVLTSGEFHNTYKL